ncbi:MAG: hypothetical protein P8018_10940 [Acidobacteriota bacterium]
MIGAKAAPFLGLALLLSCAPARRPPQATHRAPSYTARLQVSIQYRHFGMPLNVLCAFDPVLDRARLEFQDPSGVTRLLLIMRPGEGWFYVPGGTRKAQWRGPGPGLPWGPQDLWALLSADPPPGARSPDYQMGWLHRARWYNGLGKVELVFSRSETRTFPYGRAVLSGPGRAVLRCRWLSTDQKALPESVFKAPPETGSVNVPLASILREIEP